MLLLFYINSFSQITITFTIDIAGFDVGAGGIHIAGQFQTDSLLSILEDWNPGVAGSKTNLHRTRCPEGNTAAV
ncbi:MAG: hypothetical protein IPO83_16255 [Chitinophagaceae bacterium]|nr:hypothetical protein [Chitinophagaceae bacterium]